MLREEGDAISMRSRRRDVGSGRRGEDIGSHVELEEEETVNEQELLERSGVFSRLPFEIFLHIFTLLSLRSLSRCRRVNKTWYNFILHPYFANVHYEWASRNTSPYVFGDLGRRGFYLIDHEVFENLETITIRRELELKHFHPAKHTFDFEIIGCINGLLCFHQHRELMLRNRQPIDSSLLPYYICDPVTQEHVHVKSPNYKTDAPTLSGFGFNATSNQYKIIQFRQTVTGEEYFKTEVEVLTLGSEHWRTIESAPYIAYRNQHNVFVSGHLHWISYEHVRSSRGLIIVSFDVATEDFNVIKPPPCVSPNETLRQSIINFGILGVLDNKLCFIEMLDDGCGVWVMEEYGVQPSWVKKHTFVHYRWDAVRLKNGEFLMPYANYGLGYFNLQDHTCRPITIIPEASAYFPPIMLVGSLISPKGLTKKKRCVASEDMRSVQ